jgi:hypothetical protein
MADSDAFLAQNEAMADKNWLYKKNSGLHSLDDKIG